MARMGNGWNKPIQIVSEVGPIDRAMAMARDGAGMP